MSRANPRKAIDALMPLPVKAGGISVNPITLGLYAALEKIGSPLLTGETVQTLDWLPTLYLLTHDPEEALLGNLADKAFEWAKTQPVTVVEAIQRAAYAQMGRVSNVVPQAQKKKESQTRGNDGWIVQWVDYAAKRYGWSYHEIMWEVPASAIALLLRCDRVADNKIFPLSEIEKIDDGKKT